MIESIAQEFKNNQCFLLATHVNPDGDAIGSLMAMGLCLERMNKGTTLYNESLIPDVYRYLPRVDRVVGHLPEDAF